MTEEEAKPDDETKGLRASAHNFLPARPQVVVAAKVTKP
jgi:hypothetical protein